MTHFHLRTPTLDNYWRAIMLFGRNVASYKFALAKTLLDTAANGVSEVSLKELAVPFSRNLCEHVTHADKQSTSRTSTYLNACRAFNQGMIDQDELVGTTVKLAFNNVIDAFHIVNQKEVDTRFFIDRRGDGRGISLTDSLFRLSETFQAASLEPEVEARWRLVETAWSLDMSRNIIRAETSSDTLFVSGQRRINVTSSRNALNGYQRGHCFYCFDEISIAPRSTSLADVDHFFPWVLKRDGSSDDLDGVWNLVLACRECNRGANGKMARVPSLAFLGRLYQRNEFLIESHHPLRETLILQTGKLPESRRSFLQRRYSEASAKLVHSWEPAPKQQLIL